VNIINNQPIKTQRALILLCVLAFILRFPGLGWGVRPGDNPKFTELAANEPLLISMAQNFTDKYNHSYDYYPKGFSFQIALIGSLTKKLWNNEWSKFYLIGRGLSVIYGIATIYLLFLLVLELTHEPELAFLSSLFLTLTSLHVSNSHFATTDAGITFWFYLLMYCLFLYIRTKKKRFFNTALISCGMILSFKLILIALIPIIYIFIREGWDWKKVFLTLFALFAIFYIANGGQYTLVNFMNTLDNVSQDNLFVRHYNRFLNLFSYTILFITSLGLPLFLLAVKGFFQGLHNKIVYREITFNDVLYIAIFPLLLQFISICSLAYVASRHLLLLTPLLAVMAALGFNSLNKWTVFSSKKRMVFIFWLLIIYQLGFVCSIEYYFIFDNKEVASLWIRKNIPIGEKIYLPNNGRSPVLYNWHIIKKDYKLVKDSDANYFILLPDDYFRYRRSLMNLFEDYPKWENIYHPDRDEFILYQRIFKNELPVKLVDKIEQKFVTPEMYFLNKLLFGFGDDILIYKRTKGF